MYPLGEKRPSSKYTSRIRQLSFSIFCLQCRHFAWLPGAPVDLRVGQDGAVYVLSTTGITRIAAR